MKKAISLLIISFLTILFTIGCEKKHDSPIAQSNLLKIKIGMTKDELYELIGEPDTVYSDIGGEETFKDVNIETSYLHYIDYYNDYNFGGEPVKVTCQYNYYNDPVTLSHVEIMFNQYYRGFDGIEKSQKFLEKYATEMEKTLGKSKSEYPSEYEWENVCGGKVDMVHFYTGKLHGEELGDKNVMLIFIDENE